MVIRWWHLLRNTRDTCLVLLLQCAIMASIDSSRAMAMIFRLDDEEMIPEYIAVAGGKAVLPCNVSRPSPNDTISLILWYRGDAETAIYGLDARTGPIQRAKHFPSDDLSSRAYIDITGKPTSLIIEPVKPGDSGEYRCRVDYRKARTEYRAVSLDVIVPPREVIIMDEYGQRLRDVVGPYNEGAHLTLICEAEGGKPLPSVTWWKDSILVDDTYVLTPQGVVRNEYVISRLQRTDLMTVLTCQALNNNLSKPVSSSIALDLNLRPVDVRITTLKRPLLAGRKVELVCQSGGSRPPAIITWWKGSKRIPHTTEDVSTVDNLTLSTVHFVPTIEDNGVYLSCRSDHSILPDSALEDGWFLDVYYAPKLSVSLGASVHHDAVREGSDVSFECHVQANPPATGVGWLFQGKPLFTNTAEGITVKNQSLFIQNVRREQSGSYVCVAANVEGEGRSEEVFLKIHYSPLCKPGQKTVYGVAKRETVKVSCEVEADPPQVTFRWALNNSFDMITIKSFTSSKQRSVATYVPRTKLGFGALYCWGKNKVGEQKQPCIFSIIPAGPPEPVRNCWVGNQSLDGIVVRCEPGDDGGLQQRFYLEVYNTAREKLQANLTSADSPDFDIVDLPPASSFVLVLYAVNAKGRSNSVALTASTLSFPERRTGYAEAGSVSPVLGALIAIVGSLVLTAVVIVIVSKVRGEGEDKDEENNEDEKRSGQTTRTNGEELGELSQQGIYVQHNGASQTPVGRGYLRSRNDTVESLTRPETQERRPPYDDAPSRKIFRTEFSSTEGISYTDISLTVSKEHTSSPRLSESTTTPLVPLGYQRLQRSPYMIRRQSEEDEFPASCETPLMNGIYYTARQQRGTMGRQVTPLSTPV